MGIEPTELPQIIARNGHILLPLTPQQPMQLPKSPSIRYLII